MSSVAAKHTTISMPTVEYQLASCDMPVNIGQQERWLSTVAGSTLLAVGLLGSKWRLAPALLGGALVYRGLTGHCYGYSALGLSTAD